MWGQSLSRTFAAPCESAISKATVGDLQQTWFFNTDDVVTASPTVVGDTAYVGDWSGTFYALDTATGRPRWTFQADTDPEVYSGQIVSTAAVESVGGVDTVFFGSGRTLHALRADTGEPRWSFQVGTADAGDATEIESSPAVVDGKVLFGIDVHNQPGHRAGLVALDAATGRQLWQFDAEQGGEPKGCGDVWSSPSVDRDRGLAFIGTANCPASPDGWGPYTEAIIAVGLSDGKPRWSYQPHPPNNDDLDFAGAPNLFSVDGHDLVGLGNKDGTYYAVDRDSGELVWKAVATGPGLDEKGSNFSTGGFIAPTAYADGTVAGGTAVGPAPYLHAIDAADGSIRWQSSRGAGHLRAVAHRRRRAVQRRQRLHPAGLLARHRRGALVPRDEGRRGRRTGGGRRQPLRGGRHPRAGRRRSRARTAASTASTWPAPGGGATTGPGRHLDDRDPSQRAWPSSRRRRPASAARATCSPRASRCVLPRPACSPRPSSRSRPTRSG